MNVVLRTIYCDHSRIDPVDSENTSLTGIYYAIGLVVLGEISLA